MMRTVAVGGLLAVGLVAAVARSQTTQGLVTGQVFDSHSAKSVAGASVTCFNRGTGTARETTTDHAGRYALPLLSPGFYRVRVTAVNYQSLEVNEVELAVAATLTIGFALRPLSDVWEAKEYRSVFLKSNSVLQFYGPDVDPSRTADFNPVPATAGALDTSISLVVDPAQIRDLPLEGRDVYSILSTLPGASTESATGRGIGISVNGQRPSASTYLLDGVENNNYLVTGPLVTIAPEATAEYRVSTNNFSAEYGGTSGFVANAVTRSGGNVWHGMGYIYARNEFLNANDLQRNRTNRPRRPLDEVQPGGVIGGPLRKDVLFLSASFEYLRFRSQADPQRYTILNSNFQASGPFAATILPKSLPPPAGAGITNQVDLSPPAALNQSLALPRIDYRPGRRNRFMLRVAAASVKRPDFIWSPYPEYSSPLTDRSISVAGSWLGLIRPNLTIEARGSIGDETLRFDRAHPEVPAMQSDDSVTLPYSPAFYSFRNHTLSREALGNVVWLRGRHLIKVGAGGLRRSVNGYLTGGRDGFYEFDNVARFGADRPALVRVALSRVDLSNGLQRPPQYDRQYGINRISFFAQDSFRASSRLALNYGVRFENAGAPRNTGAHKDVILTIDQANEAGVRGATLQPAGEGDQPLYHPSREDWAARLGATYSLRQNASTLLRAAFGTFYDRPFDNLWQNVRNNSVVLATATPYTGATAPAGQVPPLQNPDLDPTFTRMTAFAQGLHDPRIESYFAGVQHQLSRAIVLEANFSGSRSTGLLATDIVNRDFDVESDRRNPRGRFRADLPRIFLRQNAGLSNYRAFTVSGRYRASRVELHASYSLSRSIDNQSEPLAGEFYDLLPTRAGAGLQVRTISAFSQEFNGSIDRGHSDFDQRHGFVISSLWHIPAILPRSKAAPLLRGWKIAEILGIRSGFPYTPLQSIEFYVQDVPTIYNRRLDLVSGVPVDANASIPGGKRLLNPAAFRAAPLSRQGTIARNEFYGPGFYNVDLSISRTFVLRSPRESRRLELRADSFNALNHANLGTPNPILGPGFGQAQFGRTSTGRVFPTLSPFQENARQIQLMLRFEF